MVVVVVVVVVVMMSSRPFLERGAGCRRLL